MSIFRQQIQVTDYQELQLGGPVVSAKPTRDGGSDHVDIWFEANEKPQTVAVFIFGTGHHTPWTKWTRYAYNFIDTVVTPSGLVWHVYTGPLHGQAIPV